MVKNYKKKKFLYLKSQLFFIIKKKTKKQKNKEKTKKLKKLKKKF